MQSITKNFYFKLAIFGLIISIVAALLYSTVLKSLYCELFILEVLLVSAVTAFSYNRIIGAHKQNVLRFSSTFMMMTLLKFGLYIAFMLTMLLLMKLNVASFVISFFVLYLLFSVFEVVHIMSYYQKNRV